MRHERKRKCPLEPLETKWTHRFGKRIVALELLTLVALGWMAEGVCVEIGKIAVQTIHPSVETFIACTKSEGVRNCAVALIAGPSRSSAEITTTPVNVETQEPR